MAGQVDYYNKFGTLYESSILRSDAPEYWTTDEAEKGKIYQEIKERVEQQQALIKTFFSKNQLVIDVGCGFGRQATWLARENYQVYGVDNCEVFISIAQKIFEKNNLTGTFSCEDILEHGTSLRSSQVLLLDVLEHIPPGKRKLMIQRLSEMTEKNGWLIISVPHIKKRFISWVNNQIRKRITARISFFRNKEEHPYIIPAKKQMLDLSSPFFTLTRFEETNLTDYYVFQRK